MLIEIRNGFLKFFYKLIVKRICFMFDAEKVHNVFIKIGDYLGRSYLTKKLISGMFNYQNKMLSQSIKGIEFLNPVGLSAGFDKNGEMVSIMEDVGFGFVEIGSVTAKECAGNKGKRLERVIKDKGLWVNLGLNNNGAEEVSSRLKGKKYKIAFAPSIARTNCKQTSSKEKGIEDYFEGVNVLKELGEFIVINISCPNAYGGQPFHKKENFDELFKKIREIKIKKPLFVKISPDLGNREIDELIKLARKYKIDGFVISNLTKKKEEKSGGYSGKILSEKSDKVLSYVYQKTKGEFVLIGVGGIFSAEDAYRKILLGANLVELVTGMIYEGPGLIGEINFGLVKLLKKDGFKNISEAVGKKKHI